MGGDKIRWQWRPEGRDLHLYTSAENCSSNTDKLANTPLATFSMLLLTDKFPKICFHIHTGGGEWPHGKTDTVVGNFPNLWFSESQFVRKVRHEDSKAVITPAYANPNSSFSFNLGHSGSCFCFELWPHLIHYYIQGSPTVCQRQFKKREQKIIQQNVQRSLNCNVCTWIVA